MLSAVLLVLCVPSIIYACVSGNMAAVSDGILDACSGAVGVSIGLIGMYCLFGGIMEVLRESGVIGKMSRLVRPLLRFAFPDTYKQKNGTDEICANIAANMLGIGNAATPMALSAMKKMKENAPSDTASDDMITFAVLNCSCVNLMPSTIIAMRRMAGSQRSAIVVLPIWIVSILSAVFSICIARLASCVSRAVRKRKNKTAAV